MLAEERGKAPVAWPREQVFRVPNVPTCEAEARRRCTAQFVRIVGGIGPNLRRRLYGRDACALPWERQSVENDYPDPFSNRSNGGPAWLPIRRNSGLLRVYAVEVGKGASGMLEDYKEEVYFESFKQMGGKDPSSSRLGGGTSVDCRSGPRPVLAFAAPIRGSGGLRDRTTLSVGRALLGLVSDRWPVGRPVSVRAESSRG